MTDERIKYVVLETLLHVVDQVAAADSKQNYGGLFQHAMFNTVSL